MTLGVTTYRSSSRTLGVAKIEGGTAKPFRAQTKQPVACRLCYTEA